MKRITLVFLALILMISGSAWGQATINRDDIPIITSLYMPIGERNVNIADNLTWGIGPDDIHYTRKFTGDYYDADENLYHGWYSVVNFNNKTIYTGDCYDNNTPPNCSIYHPGEDWNGNGGGNTELGEPVYSMADGIVIFKQESIDPGFGNMIQIVHLAPNGEYVISFYAHLDAILVNEGDLVYVTTQIGTVGNSGTTPVHLHWEIRRESFLDLTDSSVVSLKNTYPYTYTRWPGTDTDFITNNYYDPSDFVVGHLDVGLFADGWHIDGTSQQFLNAFGDFSPSLGVPWDNDHNPNDPNGIYVHEFFYGMYIQDFEGHNNGLDHPYASLIKGPNTADPVCLLKEGFWDHYMWNADWYWAGAPVSNEQDKTDFFDASVQPDYAIAQQFRDNNGNISYLLYGETADPIVKAVDSNGLDIDTSTMLCEYNGLKSYSDGIYHSGLKVANFGVPFELKTGLTYFGFYAVSIGQQILINPFTVSGDMTITVGNSAGSNSTIVNLSTTPTTLTAGQYFQVNLLMDNFPEEHGFFYNDFRVALLDMNDNHIQNIHGPTTVDLANGLAAAYTCMQATAGQYKIVVQYSLDEGATWSNFSWMGYGDWLTITITNDSLSAPCLLQQNIGTDPEPSIYALYNGYMYLGELTTNSIKIINISDINNIYTTATINIPNQYPMEMTLHNNYLYSLTYEEGSGDIRVLIFDVSNHSSPTMIGSVIVNALHICFSDNHLYLIGSNILEVVDVSDPTTPTVVGTTSINGNNISAVGNYAYVTSTSIFQVVDVSDPTTPTVVGTTNVSCSSIDVAGNYAYVTGSTFMVIDVSSPTTPTVVGTTNVSCSSIDVAGNYAYVSSSNTTVLDISNPTTPITMWEIENPASNPTDAKCSGNIVFIDCGIGAIFLAEKHCGLTITADFITEPTSGSIPLSVQFTDQSFDANSWLWDFGDGNTSTEQNPVHTYTTAGSYTVSLTVGNGNSYDTKTISDMIVAQAVSGVEDVPLVFRLETSHPNPFNPITVIGYTIDQDGPVKLDIYDIKGRKVVSLVDQTLSKGTYQAQFDGQSLASGVYFCRLSSNHKVATTKMALVK